MEIRSYSHTRVVFTPAAEPPEKQDSCSSRPEGKQNFNEIGREADSELWRTEAFRMRLPHLDKTAGQFCACHGTGGTNPGSRGLPLRRNGSGARCGPFNFSDQQQKSFFSTSPL